MRQSANHNEARRPSSSTSLVSCLAWLTLGSAVCFGVTVGALHVLRPDVSALSAGISHYANGPHGWLVRVAAAMLGVGGLSLVLGLALGLEPSARSRVGLAMLGLWGAAQLVTAAFPIDAPGSPPTTAGAIHGLAGLSFVAAVIAAFLLARSYRRDARWATFAGQASTFAWGLLLAAVALYVLIEPLAGLGVGGLAQRVYWVVLLGWLAVTAWQLRAMDPLA